MNKILTEVGESDRAQTGQNREGGARDGPTDVLVPSDMGHRKVLVTLHKNSVIQDMLLAACKQWQS